MLCLFEVYLTPGPKAENTELLSEEVLELTQAQVMTPEQAEAVGFQGIPPDPEGRQRLFIACAPTHARLVHSRLEASADVAVFRLHDVDV